MIGIDGASLPFIEAHLDTLPVLRRFLTEGALHHLRQRTDSLSGAMWPNFFTGNHPGVHGYYHDLAWDARAMRLRRVTEAMVPYTPFWHRLDAAGLASIAVDVPHTWPPRPGHGVEVVAWNAHDHMTPFATYPRALRRTIRRRFGGRNIGYEIPARRTTAQMERIGRRLVISARRKGELCRWLLREQPWDFFVTVFAETHRGGHLLWPHRLPYLPSPPAGALLDVYQAVDAAVGQLIEELHDATVFLFAPNGMEQDGSQDHICLPVMERLNASFLAREGMAGANGGTDRRNVVRFLRQHLPDRIQHAIGQLSPIRVRDEVVSRAFGGHDWSRTPGFAVRSDVHTYVRYNLRGRESAGMLEPGSALQGRYEDWLVRCFRSLQDATGGEPIVRDVFFTRDIYPGPRQERLPDVVVGYRYSPPARRLLSDVLGDIETPPNTGRLGNHRPDGFCVVLNPSPDLAAAGALTHVRDLAPIVLRLYGCDAGVNQ
jgi:predicted AlkP superfamily phosphohydrolase/phosphomutase